MGDNILTNDPLIQTDILATASTGGGGGGGLKVPYIQFGGDSQTLPRALTDQTHIVTLNTVLFNTIAGASLLGNELTLPAGSYLIKGSALTFRSFGYRLRLINSATSENICVGEHSFLVVSGGNAGQQYSMGKFGFDEDRFDLTTDTTISMLVSTSLSSSLNFDGLLGVNLASDDIPAKLFTIWQVGS